MVIKTRWFLPRIKAWFDDKGQEVTSCQSRKPPSSELRFCTVDVLQSSSRKYAKAFVVKSPYWHWFVSSLQYHKAQRVEHFELTLHTWAILPFNNLNKWMCSSKHLIIHSGQYDLIWQYPWPQYDLIYIAMLGLKIATSTSSVVLAFSTLSYQFAAYSLLINRYFLRKE